MRRSDLQLLPAATVVWALAVLGITVGAAAGIAGAAVIVSLALAAVMLLGGTRTAHAVFAHLGVMALAGALLFPALQRHTAATEVLEDAAAEALTVEMVVVTAGEPAPPDRGPPWSRSGLQTMARTVRGHALLGKDEAHLPASLPLLLRAQGEGAEGLSQARPGDRVHVRGTLREGGGLLVLSASGATALQRDGAAGIADDLRHALRMQAREATGHLPDDEAALVRGMTSGDTAGMGEETEEIMRRAGISHLVAVSGANIALVLGAVIAPLLLVGVRRRPRIALAAAAVAGYVWLVGEEPSVQRAATMVAPLLAARFVGVRASPVAALALTVALWSVIDPVTASSVGFMLSALATASILIAAPPLATAITELSRGRIGHAAALVLAVPAVAQLVCTPILILLTPEISIWAVPVNITVGPIVGPTTVIGLLAMIVGSVVPPLSQALNTLAGGGAHLVLLISRTADALPGSRIAVPEGATGVLLAIAVLLAGAITLAARRIRLVRWVAAAALVVALAPGIGRLTPFGSGPQWLVAVCAIGQGDAVLLRGSAGSEPTVLIDTGPDPAALTDCLNRLQVTRIDLLVLSHPHQDHIGGNTALTGPRAPAEQWNCPIPEARAATVGAVPAETVTTGWTWESRGLELEVLWPPSAEAAQSAAAREHGSGDDTANDCSVTLAATWPDGTRLVSLGDLEPVGQQELLALDPGAADIVKVAHHGSRFQHEPLYQHLGASVALVPAGRDNPFGHPTDELLEMLDDHGTTAVRTDVHGTVILPAEDPSVPRSVGPAR